MDKADSLHLAGEFDSASALWTRALQQGRQIQLSVVEGRALTGLGLAAYRTGDYTAAAKHLHDALAVQHRAGIREQYARAYNALGLVAYQQGRLVQSAAFYDSSRAAAVAVSDTPGIAKAIGNLALVQFELGEYDRAREGFEAMRSTGQKLSDARMEGNALNNLGMLDVRLGNSHSALTELTEARRLYRSIDYTTGEQNNLGQLATAHAAAGEYVRAFALLDTALAMCRKLKLRQEEANNLETLATLHLRAGDPQRALRLFSQAQAINRELELLVESGANARDRALISREVGRLDAAIPLVREALAAHRQAGARLEELNDVLLLAELEQASGRSKDEIESRLAEAETLAKSLSARTARTRLALARARIADKAGDASAVLNALTDGPSSWELAGYTGLAEGFTLRARANARRGALDQAISDGRSAVNAVDRIRSGLGSVELRTRVAATYATAVSDLVGALVRRGSIVDAFEASDASKGRTLVEHIESAPSTGISTDASALVKRENLLRQITALMVLRSELDTVARNADRSALLKVERRLADLRTEYESLVSRSASAPAVIGGRAASAAAIQSALDDDEILLEYLVARDRLHIFVVSRGGVQHVDTPAPIDEIVRRARLAHDLLAPRGAGSRASQLPMAVLQSLHESLITPVGKLIPRGARVVIVSHGALGRVPFAALRGEKGHWLVEDHSLLQVPSGGALVALRTRRTNSSARGERAAFAPLPTELPGSAREVAAVAGTISAVRSYVGSAATERAFRTALSHPGIVHVATHGWLNDRNPTFSRIDLYGNGVASPDNDGRLEVHELFAQQLGADLVFLSGCETATGAGINAYQGGEEYSALAQMLLHAHVRNVVATVWRIDDAAAAYLAERFYKKLPDRSPADALADAQRDLIKSGRFSHPRFWAAYQASGDGRPVLAHQSRVVSVQ
ncbi:MAG TPA: CHAT domain-containing protein [Gemmatimonadaceae bacterium]|nr:CHAT domain-containing protein [Gemmatimonadaceae bacterium]